MTPVKGAVVTGLVRRPQFEDVIRYRNPKVQIPFRQAWFERNSHHMSQFDGVGNDLEVEGLVEHLREQASEAHAHAAMQQPSLQGARVAACCMLSLTCTPSRSLRARRCISMVLTGRSAVWPTGV